MALGRVCPGMSLRVFSDRDIGEQGGAERRGVGLWACGPVEGLPRELRGWLLLVAGETCAATAAAATAFAAGPRRGEVEAALSGADVFFGSLLFDFDQVGGVVWRGAAWGGVRCGVVRSTLKR